MTWPVDGEPTGRWSAMQMIGKGVEAAPALRRGIGATFALAMVGAAGRVVVPILVQQAIDRGLKEGQVDVGVVMMLGVIGFGVIVIATIAQRTAVARLGLRSEEALYSLRVKLFEHIHRLSLADHSEERKGGLVARVTSDVETLSQFFSWGALAWLLDGTLMLMVAAVMLAYDWVLALVAFATAAPLAFVLRSVQRHLVEAYDTARVRNAEVLTAVSEVVSGSETLQAYGAGKHYAEATKRASHNRSNAFIRANTLGAFLFPSGEVFSVLTVAAVVVVGLIRGPESGLTSGAMVGFIFLTYRFLEPIAEFTEVLDQTQTAVAGLRRVLGVLDNPIGPPEPAHPVTLPPGRLGIGIENVTFSYRSRSDEDEPPVLVDITAQIPAGQQVAIVGETGSGKTTLGRLIARFADPTVGILRLGGVPLTAVANDELRTRLVVVPQEPFLFDGTIAANLGFARPMLSVPDLEGAVVGLDLSDWLETLPDGLFTQVGQRGAQLSAGERQLVALVRASLVDPDVLVLDEATSSVDALTEVRIGRALDKLAEGRTSIAIAHRLSTAARADRVLVLDHGHLVEDGTHAELLAAGGIYARMFDAWIAATASNQAAR
jgi:putative ABC transport system ATP-binding protein